MASLGLGLIGAAVGAALFPGVGIAIAIGWTIGSTIGGLLDRKNTDGPAVQDRTVQVSTYGAAIPITFGRNRIAGNIIWPKVVTVNTGDEGGGGSKKGGGGKKGDEATIPSSTVTFAVLWCEGPIEGFGRMWMNDKLVDDGQGNRDPCIAGLTDYLGDEVQTPDPLMVAADGSAPAYRGFAYSVFLNLELTASGFGNRPPTVEREIFTSAVTAPPVDRVSYDGDAAPNTYSQVNTIALVDPVTGNVWTTTQGFMPTVETYITDETTQSLITSISLPVGTNVPSSLVYVPIGASGREIWMLGYIYVAQDSTVIYNADACAHVATVDLGYVGTATIDRAVYNPVTNKVFTVSYGGICSIINPFSRSKESTFALGAYGVTWCPWITVTSDYLAVWTYGSYSKLTLLNIDDYSVALVIDDWNAGSGLPYTGFAYDPVREKLLHLGSTNPAYGVIDIATGSISLYTIAPAADADPDYSVNYKDIIYCPYNDRYIIAAYATPGPPATKTTLYVVNPDTQVTEHTWTYDDYDAANTPAILPPLLIPKDDPNYILALDQSRLRRLYLGGGLIGEAITVGSIVQAIMTRGPNGFDPGDIDVTDPTEIDGYLIGSQMTRRAAIEPLQPYAFFDIVESDHQLKLVTRGQAPVVTIPKDDRAARVEGDDAPPHLTPARASELELPWEVDVVYADGDTDYQPQMQYDRRITRNSNDPRTLNLPIVMSASKAKAVAMTNLYLMWLRTKFVFTTGYAYSKYEPTDVVTLPTDDVTYIARITKRSDKMNGVIEWEAELDDIAVYDQLGVVAESKWVPQTLVSPLAGATRLALMDMPILRDDDDDPGWYAAACGYVEAWPGALLARSADSGASYSTVATFARPSVIGSAQSVLGDFTAGNIWDEGNSFTVLIPDYAVLLPATEDQCLNGTNYFVLGAADRWEVGAFRNADLLAPNTYQISGLLRGRRGTEWATGTHLVGDTFVLVDAVRWRRIAASTGELGLARLYQAFNHRTLDSQLSPQSFVDYAVGLKPYSVVNLTGTRDGADLVIEWDARSRIGYGTLNAIVPVGEATESYRIQIMDGVTVKRTLTSSTPTVTYTAAQQVTDWGTTTGPYIVQVVKMSATVGAGYTTEESLA